MTKLIELDQLEDVATLKSMESFFSDTSIDLPLRLRSMGDKMVIKLVEWTKRLPYLSSLPISMLTSLLTHRWHLILLLSTRYSTVKKHLTRSLDANLGMVSAYFSLDLPTEVGGQPISVDYAEMTVTSSF